MIALEEFSELLGVLYSIPLRQNGWEHFLDLLCEHTGSMNGILLCANHRFQASVQAQGGKLWDPELVRAFETEYVGNDPLRPAVVRAGNAGVTEGDSLLPYESLWASDMYRHLVEPCGGRYPTHMLLTVTLRRLEVICFWRTAEEGEMTPDGRRLLELLLPHVRQALNIRYALGVVEARAHSAEAMADASRTAVFLLSEQGELMHRNRAAKLILADGDGLVLHNGALTASNSRMRVPLRNLLLDACQPGGFFAGPNDGVRASASVGRALSLERGAGRLPLHLLASPAPQTPGGDGRAVLLLVTDPENPVDLSDEMMRAYYGFTAAETEIANGLLTGYSVEEIAALRRVTVGTVRYQMRSLFAKTGAGRQSDLVRMLLALPQSTSQGAGGMLGLDT
jgi:DNA-binding CsgD family transcriptional regulator